MTTLLDVRGLVHKRGEFELRVDDWRVASGEVVALVGPNGAGKSTLLELAHGAYPADRGTIRLAGFDPWHQAIEAKRRAGFAGEDQEMWSTDVRTLLRTLAPYYPNWDAAYAAEVQRALGVEDGWRWSKVSRGQKMRIRLLAAMAFRPQILLLDEPSSGLDVGNRHRLLEAILDLARDGTRSVVISSHLVHDLERVADSLVVLHQGRVDRAGPMHEQVPDGKRLEEVLGDWGVAG